jgi:hypothetical protein
MYREPITTVLTEVAKVLGPTGVSVNTWLLVDRAAETAMRLGLADRQLPYEFDGFLSYSQDNPLACSAYRLDVVEEIYRSAGHTIVDIQHGSWSGRVPSQHMTYQDVVVSAPAK